MMIKRRKTSSESIDCPMVSILCLAYNHEKFLSQALDSFLMQRTDFSFEIVVGEDCSQDGTAEILSDYAERFPGKIHAIFNTSNIGMIQNAMRTHELCRGKYIASCEGDDYWTDPEKLQKQVDFLEKNPDYVLCFHDALTIKDGVISSRPQPFSYLRRDVGSHELLMAPQLPTLTVCYRNIIKEIPSTFHHTPILDLCIWSLLGAHGRGKFIKNINPAIYRIHPGGAISMKAQSIKYKMTADTLSLISDYWKSQFSLKLARKLTLKSVAMEFMRLNLSEMLIFTVNLPIFYLIRFIQFIKAQITNHKSL
ncbi:MAG: glycosyltransferase [Delftia acidovorans]|nr:glycosyltransferase [Delftia acidovorans]